MIRKRKGIGSFIFILLSFFINSITVDAANLSTDNGSSWTYYNSLSNALTQAQSSGTASKPAIVKLSSNATGFAKEYYGYITLDLNGYTISNSGTNYNGVQRCLRITGGVFTIKDSSSSKSGKIIGGNTPDQGGMVAYVPGGKLILESGTLTATGSGNNGGIISIGNGTFEMRGGKITGGKATVNGGGVEFYNPGSFIMTGGTIESNQATGVGNGVYWRQGNVTVGGTAVIKGNTGGENLYLTSGKKIVISTSSPLKSGADIYVSTAVKPTKNNPVIITTDSNVNNSAYFHSDNQNYKIYNKVVGTSNRLVLSVHEHIWSYKAEDNKLIAYCSEDFGHANCDYYGETNGMTLSLTAVSPTFQSEDGIPCWKHTDAVTIAVTGTESWNTVLGADSVPTIYYKGIEDTDYSISTQKPTNAGLYEATITKGVAKASLKFRIREVYNVSFDKNGGRGIMTQVSVPAGEFNLPECIFYAPVNHVFGGWSYSTSGEIISTESISLTRNITLYAKWLEHFHDYTNITIREGVTKSSCDCGYYIIRYSQ